MTRLGFLGKTHPNLHLPFGEDIHLTDFSMELEPSNADKLASGQGHRKVFTVRKIALINSFSAMRNASTSGARLCTAQRNRQVFQVAIEHQGDYQQGGEE